MAYYGLLHEQMVSETLHSPTDIQTDVFNDIDRDGTFSLAAERGRLIKSQVSKISNQFFNCHQGWDS